MAGHHPLPARLIRLTSLCVCIAVVLSAISGVPFQAVSSKESIRLRKQGAGQGNSGRERRVNPPPPRTGPPASNLPNLDDLKHRQVQAPRAVDALPSLMRSRRKPLESRNGRRVGDPFPPISRPTPLATPTAFPSPTALTTPLFELTKL
jgi:hypothetical protein